MSLNKVVKKKTCRDAFLSSTRVKIHFMFTLAYEGLVYKFWDAFYVFPGIGWIWSTQVEILFVSSLSLERFCQHMLRCICRFMLPCNGLGQHILSYILYPPWHGMGFSNTSWDIFCVPADMGAAWSTRVDIYFG